MTDRERIRINLSVSKEMNDLLSELAELTGRPKATIVRHFLHDIQPAMEMTRDGLKALKSNESVAPTLASMLSVVDGKIDEINQLRLEVNDES
jgi:predicted DNA-binding protein